MIKIQRIGFSFPGDEISESEITVEEACRILHSLSWQIRAGTKVVCESVEDKRQLVKTYYSMYHDEFNIQHHIDDKEQRSLQLAYPATTDVFYVENLAIRFEAGIRKLDPRYARVNTHQTNFIFQMTPIYECIAINSEQNEQTKAEMRGLQKNIIYKHEQLNHLSYEDAKEYLKQVWSAYQGLFGDDYKLPDIDRIIDVNQNFDVPWYNRL